MVLGGEGLEVELSIELEVAQVVLLGVPQVQLRGGISTMWRKISETSVKR